jgi:methyl-accepting chemotaxis protein/methyl-accepting chemotaxis protein-1 (serine sensor receptor)
MQQSIQAINSSTREVSKIIKAVDEIAFQTNILALNAAVEAARAGQAGLGFGVVAEEVRNLAQRCGAAATDTETLIEQSIASAQEGQSRLATLTAAFERSSQIQTAMKEQADQIALSSDEQSRGVNEIRRALLEINEVTQATAAHSQENAVAGERLTSQVKDFDAIISRLNVLVG